MDEIGRIINLKWLTVIFKTIITNVIHNLYQSNILNSEFISLKIFIFCFCILKSRVIINFQ